jgi:pyruvate dehydrogenase E2 component (dihydrolipoamide acetyltransferase)
MERPAEKMTLLQCKEHYGWQGIREQRPRSALQDCARRVQEAWQTIPHIVQMVEVDATSLRALRSSLRTEIPSLTVNDLLLHAAAQVLASLPNLNGAVAGEVLTLYDSVDIGFAVDTPRGLMVPVIRRAETLSVAQLAAESQRLIEVARAGRLGPEYEQRQSHGLESRHSVFTLARR